VPVRRQREIAAFDMLKLVPQKLDARLRLTQLVAQRRRASFSALLDAPNELLAHHGTHFSQHLNTPHLVVQSGPTV
jgi:hypothetical protein